MKRALNKLVTEWDELLQFAGDDCWTIEGITNPNAFFQHLPIIFPYGMTLFIEGCEIGLTAKSWYEEYPANYEGKVACDTLMPIPESFHVAFSEQFAEGLCQIITSQGLWRAFYHIKGYTEREILFSFHDAFDNAFTISSCVSEANVREFANKMGLIAQATKFPPDRLEKLRKMNRIFNPPWWKRVLRKFGKA
jgi:hypothetical protein